MKTDELTDVGILTGTPSPIVATAIHDGHFIREELLPFLGLSSEERLREEDPFTAGLISDFPATIVGIRSRFEFDLNRSPEKAVYRKPEDAWGLHVWKNELPEEMALRSEYLHSKFFNQFRPFFQSCIDQYGSVVVYDCHSYNHRRDGAGGLPAAQSENPDINLGTQHVDRATWGPLVDALTASLSSQDIGLLTPDVRENVKFKGGYFAQWLRAEFGTKVCPIAIEFKKIFMDEWTGKLDEDVHFQLRRVLKNSVPEILELRAQITATL